MLFIIGGHSAVTIGADLLKIFSDVTFCFLVINFRLFVWLTDGDSWLGDHQSLHRCPRTVARDVTRLLGDGVGAAFIVSRYAYNEH